MPTQERLTIDERFKYLRIMLSRYKQADRKERSRLLSDMECATGLQRKTIIRRMNGILVRQPRIRQRGRIYGPEMEDVLKVIAESEDNITAERLTPNLKWLAEYLMRHGELQVSAELLEQLQHISTLNTVLFLENVPHKVFSST